MKTRWYPAAINPARKGWYEVQYYLGTLPATASRRYFDGQNWLHTPESEPGNCLFGIAADKWRGLTEAGLAQAYRRAVI